MMMHGAGLKAPPAPARHDASDGEADAEDTADDESPSPTPNGIRPHGPRQNSSQQPKTTFASLPNSPDPSGGEAGSSSRRRFGALPRRSTMPDSGAMSEGEGRDMLSPPVLRRNFMLRRKAGEAEDAGEDNEAGPSRRRMNLRRISRFGSSTNNPNAEEEGGGGLTTPKRPFFTAGERATTYGAQRWKQVKNTFGMLKQKRPEAFDFLKSAELMAELQSGAPAALMLASMLQRDEHGNRRIPVLLEQVKVTIRESQKRNGQSERHTLFTLDLEYGSGDSRMTWTVYRTIREILKLHIKYRLAIDNERYLHPGLDSRNRPKQPHFPTKAFPYLRGVRGLDDSDDEGAGQGENQAPGAGEDAVEEPENINDVEDNAPTLGTEPIDFVPTTPSAGDKRPVPKKKRSRMSALTPKRHQSGNDENLGVNVDSQMQAAVDALNARRRFIDRQQRMLEKYLQEMIRWLMFRADSNRLCRFLELSALGVRLAAEGSYHGKECFLHIQSAKGLDFRRVLTPAKVIARHTRKWFLVRQSYIACVESPEKFDIYDVYLVDSKFKIIHQRSRIREIGRGSDRKEDQGQDNNNNNNNDDDQDDEDEEVIDLETGKQRKKTGKHHTLKIITSERKVTLVSFNQHLIQQFEASVHKMMKNTLWIQQNRFGSFAPVRTRSSAQWLVDGRDYMWNVSRAIAMAKDVIYIHDWWLSPEIYMRRPPCISQKWRLDRLLQRKAREGVKIFIIVYRNVEAAVPIDSEYTKYALLNLHPNIFVQRSPNQFKKNQFFFAHHEKICIVDHHVAFLGGLDLCFGRWDTPQHSLTDNKLTGFEEDMQNMPRDADHCQLFPGKDYSNPRIQDFFRLREPYEEMYDRELVPRMPWHDVSMQVVGQPARDLTRHFVQRWNYVRRGRKPTRPLPFLLPPPDFVPHELERMGLDGTCEVQILRSASTWSLGIEHTEASIQEAYLRMIEQSEHFVYIENQFFITSTETMGARIQNRIGDALVNRIIRAAENDEDWRCVVVIPLMPGFQNTVAEQEGTSVRLILQCQFRSICRGEGSIFGRLRAAGINPEDYIQFFSLRQWGRIGGIGKEKMLTTEQLYIHAKTIIVDDRVALIGSANINERSMVGNRDSEVAAVIRDTDMIWSTMGGKPYRVGRFAYTLRMRLMREHLGLDVDEILEEERHADLERQRREAEWEADMDEMYRERVEQMTNGQGSGDTNRRGSTGQLAEGTSAPPLERGISINHDVDMQLKDKAEESRPGSGTSEKKPDSEAEERKLDDPVEHKKEVEGESRDRWRDAKKEGVDQGRDSVVINGHEVLLHDISAEGHGSVDKPKVLSESSQHPNSIPEEASKVVELPPMPKLGRRTTDQLGFLRANQLPPLPLTDDSDIGGPAVQYDKEGKPFIPQADHLAADIKLADVTKDCMRDPLDPAFYDDVWQRVADNNTKLFRRVFRVMPDNEVLNWQDYSNWLDYQIGFKNMHEPKPDPSSPNAKADAVARDPEKAAAAAQQNLPADAGGKGPSGASVGGGVAPPAKMAQSIKGKFSSLAGVGNKIPEDSVPNINVQSSGLSEKSIANESRPQRHMRQNSRLDVEKAAAAARALVTQQGTVASTPAKPPPSAGSTIPPTSSEGKDPIPKGLDLLHPSTSRHTSKLTSFAADPEKSTAIPQVDGTQSSLPPSLPSSLPKPTRASSTINPVTSGSTAAASGTKRRRRATTRTSRRGLPTVDDVLNKAEADSLCRLIQGHLVMFPYDWLLTEEANGNWLYQVDQVAPLQIYD